MILDELAIDVREVEEEEERSGGQGQAAPTEETFYVHSWKTYVSLY